MNKEKRVRYVATLGAVLGIVLMIFTLVVTLIFNKLKKED